MARYMTTLPGDEQRVPDEADPHQGEQRNEPERVLRRVHLADEQEPGQERRARRQERVQILAACAAQVTRSRAAEHDEHSDRVTTR